jgi:NAD(P)-dependent dehydrogenase (short-subunit alcohol dehydrogenase family)
LRSLAPQEARCNCRETHSNPVYLGGAHDNRSVSVRAACRHHRRWPTAGWIGWDLGASTAFHAAKHGQSGFSDALRHELTGTGIRVTALYPSDFDDIDPLGPDWGNSKRGKISNREVVDTILSVCVSRHHDGQPGLTDC